jgi:Putative redox-active protein (C_GCAxxG_C_C)
MNDYDLDILKLARQGFCCSQIVLHLALDLRGQENRGLIRAMSGLCHGSFASKGACGALTGAACLLALYAGKGTASEEADEKLPLMEGALAAWFEEYATTRFGGINCSDIVSDGRPDTSVCGLLVGECYGQAMTILVENGFDPAGDSRP